MKLLQYIFFFSVFLIFYSCDDGKQQAVLQQRETELAEKEKRFAGKQAEYNMLLKMRDSIRAERDSVVINPMPVDITGKWTGKVVCTESNCPDYVVGDTKVDDWEISKERDLFTVKNLNKTGTVRVYKGKYDGSALRVVYTAPAEAEKHLDLKIDFTGIEEKKLSGTREAQVNRSCLSKFTIELTR